jgi:hypothetical protein
MVVGERVPLSSRSSNAFSFSSFTSLNSLHSLRILMADKLPTCSQSVVSV